MKFSAIETILFLLAGYGIGYFTLINWISIYGDDFFAFLKEAKERIKNAIRRCRGKHRDSKDRCQKMDCICFDYTQKNNCGLLDGMPDIRCVFFKTKEQNAEQLRRLK